MSTAPTTQSTSSIKLTDWEAALAAYVVLLFVAEVETLQPIAVAIAAGIAVIIFLHDNPLKKVS